MIEIAPILLASAFFIWVLSRAVVRVINASRGADSGAQRGRIADLEEEVEDLSDRVEVLEKIVTDQKYQLEREIRNLAG